MQTCGQNSDITLWGKVLDAGNGKYSGPSHQPETEMHMEKVTWHQNSRFQLRENKSLLKYSRVVLENLIRCTAAEMRYLTVATYIDK